MVIKKKTDADPPPTSPIAFRPCSNGEYCPPEPTARDARAEAAFLRLVEERHRRAGMSRREFAQSASGFAAALCVLNEVYGCGGDDGGGGAIGESVRCFAADPTLMDDEAMAAEVLSGDEFIFDVQVHTSEPLTPWRDGPLPNTAEDFIRTLFVGSDTTVCCLSGAPNARPVGVPNAEAKQQMRDLIDRLAGPRLLFHVNADPPRGPSELDYMQQTAEDFEVSAWKVYPHVGAWRLDDQENGQPFLERSRELGVRVVAAHRGIAADRGGYDDASSPIDLVRAARQHPDITFLTYHSGWQSNVDEDHPFDPDDEAPRGVDRLIKGVIDEGIGPDGNVYAELGSTWRNLMTSPREAAHVLGKLLRYLGEDRIIWGTDAVFTGSPQEQIVAFRAFEIPTDMQQMYGYPPITDAGRRKIFGLNAAGVYGVDPDAVRCAVQGDRIAQLRDARRQDPRAVPIPEEKNYGPRNRREFMAFLRWQHYQETGV